MRVTCDANFLVRAALHPKGLAAAILGLCLRADHVLVLSPLILNHADRALRDPRIQKRYEISNKEIEEFLHHLRGVSDLVISPRITPVVSADPDDDEIIATAVDGKAEVIGTLDQHFEDHAVISYCSARGIRILTDIQLIQELRAGFREV